MRFNPLWLILFLFLMPGLSLFFLPLLLLAFAFVLLTGFAGGGALWLARAPKQAWALLSSARVRANFALANATCRVLAQRTGYAFRPYAAENGFFLSGADDENLVFEAAMQALARLKNGESDLVVFPACSFFRMSAGVLVTAAVCVPLTAAAGLLGLIAAVAAGVFLSPYLSPLLQKLILGGAKTTSLQVQSVTRRNRTVSAAGGRIAGSESGVETLTSAQDVLEAEIVDD